MDHLPPAAIKKAAANERQMLEDDMAKGREESLSDVTSILMFCRFLESAERGIPAILPNLPLEHWTYYLKIIQKLVEAGDLTIAENHKSDGTFLMDAPQTTA